MYLNDFMRGVRRVHAGAAGLDNLLAIGELLGAIVLGVGSCIG